MGAHTHPCGVYQKTPTLYQTQPPPVLYLKTPRQIPKNPKNVPTKPSNVPKNPPNVPKNPPIDVARMDSHKCNMHQQKHPFYHKKNQLSSPCMLHLWTFVYEKANLVAPFHTKNPRMGYLGVFSFPPLSTTHTPLLHPSKTLRTLTFSSMTFHSLSYLHALESA